MINICGFWVKKLSQNGFQLVKNLNLSIKKYINDYSVLTKNNVRHRKRYYRYIRNLLDSGVPIDGIGFQSRIFQKDLTQPHQRKLFVLRMTFLVLVLNFKSLSLILKLQTKIFRQSMQGFSYSNFQSQKK